MLAVRTLNAEKTVGEVAAAQAVVECRLAGSVKRAEVFEAIGVIFRCEARE